MPGRTLEECPISCTCNAGRIDAELPAETVRLAGVPEQRAAGPGCVLAVMPFWSLAIDDVQMVGRRDPLAVLEEVPTFVAALLIHVHHGWRRVGDPALPHTWSLVRRHEQIIAGAVGYRRVPADHCRGGRP